jgi:hypothetical protein
MSYTCIWTLQNCISEKWLKLVIKNNLIDQFKHLTMMDTLLHILLKYLQDFGSIY